MKVYVDSKDIELTKELFERANVYDWYNCNLDDELELVSLTDYTKKGRKEVCEKIKNEVKKLIDKDFKLCNHEYANGYCYGLQYDLVKILDQIQGETK